MPQSLRSVREALVSVQRATADPQYRIKGVSVTVEKHLSAVAFVVPDFPCPPNDVDMASIMGGLCQHMWVHHTAHGHAMDFVGLAAEANPTIYIGHGLGGVVAQILALTARRPVITFGSPRAGDRVFAQAIEPLHTRVVHRYDRLAGWPSLFYGYRHGGHRIKVGRFLRLMLRHEEPHLLSTYDKALRRL